LQHVQTDSMKGAVKVVLALEPHVPEQVVCTTVSLDTHSSMSRVTFSLVTLQTGSSTGGVTVGGFSVLGVGLVTGGTTVVGAVWLDLGVDLALGGVRVAGAVGGVGGLVPSSGGDGLPVSPGTRVPAGSVRAPGVADVADTLDVPLVKTGVTRVAGGAGGVTGGFLVVTSGSEVAIGVAAVLGTPGLVGVASGTGAGVVLGVATGGLVPGGRVTGSVGCTSGFV